MQDAIRMFRKSLFTAFYNWLDVNKEAIGEKWYTRLFNEARKSDSDTAIKIMGTALWMFNMIAGFGVLAGIGPNKVNLQHLDERLDRKSTMRLLHMIASSMSLQYLPREIATKEIPVITAKRFSLKLWVSENQPS